jgi:hypothetical protein
MSNDLRTGPVPTLGYYEGERSTSAQFLVRLVLLVGAASALMDTVGHSAVLLRSWSEARRAFTSAAPSSVEGLSVVVTGAQILLSLAATLGCLILATTARGILFTLAAEAGLIGLLAASLVLQTFNYLTLGAHGTYFFATLIMQLGSTFIHASLIPSLVIVVLVRRDLRPR